jgi:hypothetical protein
MRADDDQVGSPRAGCGCINAAAAPVLVPKQAIGSRRTSNRDRGSTGRREVRHLDATTNVLLSRSSKGFVSLSLAECDAKLLLCALQHPSFRRRQRLTSTIDVEV